MAYNYTTNGALQVVHKNVSFGPGGTGTSAYAYTDIPGTDLTITLKEANSILYLQCYVQGWGNGGNGGNIAFKINGVVAGNSSSSNGDQWSRALNGGTGNKSWNIGRAMMWKPNLNAGSNVSIILTLGTWSTAGINAGWSTHPSFFNVTAIELKGG
jgi:hypothetical protein